MIDRRAALGLLGAAFAVPALAGQRARAVYRVGGLPPMPDGDLQIHILLGRLGALGLDPSVRQEGSTLRVEIDAREGLAIADLLTRPGAFAIHRDVRHADGCETPPEGALCLPTALADSAFLLVDPVPVVGGPSAIAAAAPVETAGMPGLSITLRDKAARAFAEVTAAELGNRLAVAVDGLVLMAPVVRTPIPDGILAIHGGIDDAALLAAILSQPPLQDPLVFLGQEAR